MISIVVSELVYTRGPLVNDVIFVGTVVYVSAYKGGPCVLDQVHMAMI